MTHRENGGDIKPATTYEVRRSRSSIDTRFKPGQSGNPKGRPKKTHVDGQYDDLMKILFHELQQQIFIEENGKKIQVTKREVIAKQILKKALMGDNRCLDFVLRTEEKYARSLAGQETDPAPAPADPRMISPVWKRFQKEFEAQKSSP